MFFLVISVIKAVKKKYEGFWFFAVLLFAVSVFLTSLIPSSHAEDKLQIEINNLMYDEFGINESEYVLTKKGEKSNGYIYSIKTSKEEYEVLVKDNKILKYQPKE